MSILSKILPWRLKTLVGHRPKSVIDDQAFFSAIDYKIVRRHHPSSLTEIALPVNVEDSLPASYSHVSVEKINRQCSDYYCAVLGRATFLDVNYLVTIIKDNKILGPLSIDYNRPGPNHRALSIESYPPKQKLTGTTIALSSTGARNNYFHFVLELCQRIGFLEGCGISMNDADHILINKPLYQFQRDAIRLFNIPEHKIVETEIDSCFECENLIVPSIVQHSFYGYEYVRQTVLAQVSLSSGAASPKKIYCSRRSTGVRSIVNEKELADFLKQTGFEVVYFEDYSVSEQARMAYNSEVILSPHGAGMTNIIFAKEGTKIIELLNSQAVNLIFYVYALYANLQYASLICNPADQSDRSEHDKDIIVDIPKLKELLKKMDIV